MPIVIRGFWNSYRIALRRIRKDRRARLFVLRVTFTLAFLLAYILFIVLAAGQNIASAVFFSVIFGGGTIAVILLRRRPGANRGYALQLPLAFL